MFKKILKLFLKILVACVFIAASYLLYRYISNLPKKISTYEGISLGMDMAEVKYILGAPNSVYYPIENLNKGKGKKMMAQALASKEDIRRSPNGENDFFDWQFDKSSRRVDVGFDAATHRVNSIGCYVDMEKFINAGTCAINSIEALDTEEVIFGKLGTPSSSVIDDFTKTVEYSNYNMKIHLVKKFTYYIIVQELR